MPRSMAWHSSEVWTLGAGLEAAVGLETGAILASGCYGEPGTWGYGAYLTRGFVCDGAGVYTEVSHRISSPLSSQRVSFSVLGFVEK